MEVVAEFGNIDPNKIEIKIARSLLIACETVPFRDGEAEATTYLLSNLIQAVVLFADGRRIRPHVNQERLAIGDGLCRVCRFEGKITEEAPLTRTQDDGLIVASKIESAK
jgi:hypothetical protein